MKKIISLLMLFLLTSCESSENLNLYKNTFSNYLNTVVQLQVYYEDDVDIETVVDEIEDVLKTYDKDYNAHSEESVLHELNQSAYESPFEVDEKMYGIISLAIEYASLYDSAYDPTILPLSLLWGIDESSYYMGGEVPSQEEIDKVLEYTGYEYVILNDDKKTISFEKEGVMLDLGSIVKGYVANDIKTILESHGIKSAIVDVGSSSQIMIGNRPTLVGETYQYTDDPFNIGYSDPEDVFGFGAYVGIYKVSNIAVSGSGISRQFFEVDGVEYHHIFNPSTGYPVENDLESIQIFSSDYVSADALSTMLFAIGLDAAMEYVESIDGLDAIFLTKDNRFYLSSNAPEFEVTDNDYSIRSYKK